MLPITIFPAAFIAGVATVELLADVRLALRRANIDLTEAAITLETRLPKLSAQLHGAEPFTLFRRFAELGPVFWQEFNDVRAKRFGQRVVPTDLGALVASVETLTKRMAKADLPSLERKRA